MKALIFIGCLTAGLFAGGGVAPTTTQPIDIPKPCDSCGCGGA